MPVTERDKRRLEALTAIVKPANSIAARIGTLTPDQREWYDGWKAHYDRWMRRNDQRAYELILNGFGPIGLREDINILLFGAMPRIVRADDEATASEKYRRFCDD